MLSIVTVTYRSTGDLPGLLESIEAHPPPSGRPETVVVDNASGDGVGELVARRFPWVKFVGLSDNRGMGAGLNVGVRECKGDGLLLVNPDLRFTPGALAGFEEYRRRDAAGGPPRIVGPRLLNADGSLQLSAGRFPNLLRLVTGQLHPRPVRKYVELPVHRPSLIDWVTGACMYLSRPLFEALGGFDEQYFLYYEETDLCRRARRRGWWSLYDPGIVCYHLHPLQDRPVNPVVAGHIRASRRLYFRRHCGPLESAALELIDRWR